MITPTQRQARNQGVGASECASILGLDPWRSAYDLWLLKTEKHETTEDGADETEAQEIGNLIEGTTAALAERRLGCKIVKPTGTYKAANGIMFANLDRQVEKAARGFAPVELKSTSMTEGWGEPGTDEVPDRVLVQVTVQMLCSDSEMAHVAQLLGRRGFSFNMYRVDYNPVLGRIIEDRVCEFWRKNVEGDTPPDDSLPSIGAISHVRRQAGKVIQLPPETIEAFSIARAAKKKAEEIEDEARAVLLAALGDAEGAKAPGWSVSFKTVTQKRFDLDSLKAAHTDIDYSAFYKSGGYRRLDVRESKS